MVPFVKNGKKQQHRHFIEASKELTNEKMWKKRTPCNYVKN
jgi:hypothetical protein